MPTPLRTSQTSGHYASYISNIPLWSLKSPPSHGCCPADFLLPAQEKAVLSICGSLIWSLPLRLRSWIAALRNHRFLCTENRITLLIEILLDLKPNVNFCEKMSRVFQTKTAYITNDAGGFLGGVKRKSKSVSDNFRHSHPCPHGRNESRRCAPPHGCDGRSGHLDQKQDFLQGNPQQRCQLRRKCRQTAESRPVQERSAHRHQYRRRERHLHRSEQGSPPMHHGPAHW